MKRLLVVALLLASPGWAAISRIGSLTEIQSSANSGSQAISVPADAQMILVGVSGYYGSANYFTGGSVTLNGAALTAASAGSNSSTSYFMGGLFYRFSPSTGTQTLAWDWPGTAAPASGVVIVYGFYKGIDTTAVRDADGKQGQAASYSTKTLAAQSGDMIVAWGHIYGNGSIGIDWTNALKVADFEASGQYRNAAGTWAEATPTGNVAVSYAHSGGDDGGISAIVVKPSGAPAAVRVKRGGWFR